MTKGKEPLYLLGCPLGFTEPVHYQLVKALGKGTSEILTRGEVLNFKSVKEPLNKHHHELLNLHTRGENKYWCESNRPLKVVTLDRLHNLSLRFNVIRDTVDPLIFLDFLNETYNPKVLMIKVDKEYLAKELYENNIEFPTNILDEEIEDVNRNNLKKSIEKVYSLFDDLESRRTNAKILKIEDFFERPLKILDIVENMNFSVKKENYLGNKLETLKEKYNA